MKTFIFHYFSENNHFKGSVTVQAESISKAQDKFFEWLKMQPTYAHMWQLHFRAKEIEGLIQ